MSALEFVSAKFDHSTPDQWQQRFRHGELAINDAVASAVDRVRAGDVLDWNRPGWDEPDVPVDFRVLHDDGRLLAVDKPSGLPTLPGGGFYRNTLLNRVQDTFPDAKPLHRLGRATSGIVLFALDAETASLLSRHWDAVTKQYLAIASGVALRDEYDIDRPIGPVRHERLGTIHAASPDGKPSRSVARVVQRRGDSTLFAVELHTGRPHQIRIHLAAIGHPLVGDPVYDIGGTVKSDRPGLPGDPGYALHAHRIALVHPSTNQRIEIVAEPPRIYCAPRASCNMPTNSVMTNDAGNA